MAFSFGIGYGSKRYKSGQSMGNDHSPVKPFRGRKVEIGNRLKEERLRLGKTQAQLAADVGVAKKSQTNYEIGNSSPSAEYLAAVAGAGVDVAYVLTGKPGGALAPDEAELLRRYRAASAEVRGVVLAALGATVGGVAQEPRRVISGGEQGQVVMGNQHNDQPLTFNVGGKKRGKRE